MITVLDRRTAAFDSVKDLLSHSSTWYSRPSHPTGSDSYIIMQCRGSTFKK